MPSNLILVNGLPGAGKSTLARELARPLDAVVISKDAIKEAVASALDLIPEHSKTLGAASMEMAWSIASEIAGTAIVESWFFRDRDLDYVKAGLARVDAASTVEIWCQVPADLAHERVRSRRRHPVHDDAERLRTDFATWAKRARPLGLCPGVSVDTTGPVDIDQLVRHPLLTTGLADHEGQRG